VTAGVRVGASADHADIEEIVFAGGAVIVDAITNIHINIPLSQIRPIRGPHHKQRPGSSLMVAAPAPPIRLVFFRLPRILAVPFGLEGRGPGVFVILVRGDGKLVMAGGRKGQTEIRDGLVVLVVIPAGEVVIDFEYYRNGGVVSAS